MKHVEPIPFQLRSAKTADRNLFVELLRRLERWQKLDRYVYASMGGYAMADHHRVHRVLGLRKLFCFDTNDATVQRQKFNRPIEECVCVQMNSQDFVNNPGEAFYRGGINEWEGHIIWLDYTSPSEIGSQIEEFVSLLSNSKHGDIIRITLNANEKALQGASKNIDLYRQNENRFQWLFQKVAQYLPKDASAADITAPRFPKLLCRILHAAATEALISDVAMPLSIVLYSDGPHPMLAMTLLINDPAEDEARFDISLLKDWSLLSASWTDIHPLRVSALTTKEQGLLDYLIPAIGADEVIRDLPFNPLGENISEADAVDHLNKYHDLLRLYPNFITLD